MFSSVLKKSSRTMFALAKHPNYEALGMMATNTRTRFLASVATTTTTKTTTTSPTPTPTPTLATTSLERQRTLWKSYIATGRGSATLFGSIDSNGDGKIDWTEFTQFIDNIDIQDIQPRAFQRIFVDCNNNNNNNNSTSNSSSGDSSNALTLHDFQRWLIDATQEAGYVNFGQYYQPLGHQKPLPAKKQLSWNESTMSQSLRSMQYAVRGEVVIKADQLAAQGRTIIYTNIGNPQSVGQPPLTYYRQVLALCDLPAQVGVDHPNASSFFPVDVLERARELRAIIGTSGTGAYTNSQGIEGFRQQIVKYIEQRDGGIPAYSGDIFMTNGASAGIEMILTALIAQDDDGIMIPIPQYPIYSALITKLGGRQVGYYLDETKGWAITKEELERSLLHAQSQGITVKGLALINPGNPTGQVLDRQDLETIALFCAEHEIVLLSDEVYQRNVYSSHKQFISAKQIAVETPGCDSLQLISFHSTSKGIIGECGRRGGYMEFHHIDKYVQSQIYKLASSGLCSNVAGQVMTSLMVQPPDVNGESYELFQQEESTIFNSLKRKATMVVEGLNAIEGITCTDPEGSMYAFPRIDAGFPQKAIDQAEQQNMTPDTFYALSLLEETGICVVPASGFGQEPGRIGFRTTFLPPEDVLEHAMAEFKRHHELFCTKWA